MFIPVCLEKKVFFFSFLSVLLELILPFHCMLISVVQSFFLCELLFCMNASFSLLIHSVMCIQCQSKLVGSCEVGI